MEGKGRGIEGNERKTKKRKQNPVCLYRYGTMLRQSEWKRKSKLARAHCRSLSKLTWNHMKVK